MIGILEPNYILHPQHANVEGYLYGHLIVWANISSCLLTVLEHNYDVIIIMGNNVHAYI